MGCVNQGLNVGLYPDEDIVSEINHNVDNSIFARNKFLEEY